MNRDFDRNGLGAVMANPNLLEGKVNSVDKGEEIMTEQTDNLFQDDLSMLRQVNPDQLQLYSSYTNTVSFLNDDIFNPKMEEEIDGDVTSGYESSFSIPQDISSDDEPVPELVDYEIALRNEWMDSLDSDHVPSNRYFGKFE